MIALPVFLLVQLFAQDPILDLPALIKLGPKSLQQSFIIVEKTIKENPEDPEPLMARAEIYASIGNNETAIKDCLQAYKLLLAKNPTPAAKIKFLSKLSEFIKKNEENPKDIFISSSWDYYNQGKIALRAKNFLKASEYFSNSISLNPKEALFFYFRALSEHTLGNVQDARRDALVGAFLQRNTIDTERTLILNEMEHFQGTSRIWLCETIKTQPITFNK
jgi:tetratricopeptide (TPR) repeat protein